MDGDARPRRSAFVLYCLHLVSGTAGVLYSKNELISLNYLAQKTIGTKQLQSSLGTRRFFRNQKLLQNIDNLAQTLHFAQTNLEICNEAHISTQPHSPFAHTRLFGPNGHQDWP
jgi:hypothetical protein